MARRLEDLLNDADELIEKKASKTKKADTVSIAEDDEVTKLAHELLAEDSVEEKPQAPAAAPWSFEEKVAHAVAVVGILSQIEELEKIGQFEKVASEKGFNQEQLDHFLGEKAAAAVRAGVAKVKKLLPAALLGGAAGTAMGYSKGNDSGYSKALNDVNQAFSEYGNT